MGVKRKRMRKLAVQQSKAEIMKGKDMSNLQYYYDNFDMEALQEKQKNGEYLPTLYVLIGISGCGKTTWAKKQKAHLEYLVNGKPYAPCDILSSDELRKELYGDENDQMHNEEVFKELHRRLKDRMRQGISVIVDATNLSLKNRRAYLNCVSKIPCYKVAVVFDVPLEVCIENQKKRDRQVPEDVLRRMRMKFEMPFYEEGYNKIVFSGYSGSTGEDGKCEIESPKRELKETELFKRQIGFDQRTRHHIYTLDVHSIKLSERIGTCCRLNSEVGKEKVQHYYHTRNLMQKVALLHDYGKMFTAMPKEDGSGDYKYFNHHNVSAYELMINRKQLGITNHDDILDFLFYVNYHMQPFFIQTKKAEKKWMDIFGEWKYYWLIVFNECDKFASGTEECRQKGDEP